MACKLGRETRPELHLGICGEHGGDPTSVEFCHKVGLDYVSCSPFRVPIARLAAAQAAIKEMNAEEEAAKVAAEKAAVEEVNEKVEAAKAALKEASDKLQAVAVDASAELKELAQVSFKSLLAGWEEAKKTFNSERK